MIELYMNKSNYFIIDGVWISSRYDNLFELLSNIDNNLNNKKVLLYVTQINQIKRSSTFICKCKYKDIKNYLIKNHIEELL